MNKYHSFLVSYVLFSVLCSCGGVRTSATWDNPEARELPTYPYGSFIRAEGETAGSKYFVIDGEFLGRVSDTTIAIRTNEGSYSIVTSSLSYAGIVTHRTHTGEFLGATFGLTILSLIDGWAFILTGPLSLAGGIVATDSESIEGNYVAEEFGGTIDPRWWSKMARYARYPQGVPESEYVSLRAIP